MIDIHLTEDEITALHDVVKSYLVELHTEISHTDEREFKKALRKRQEILQNALMKLAASAEQLV